MEETKKHENEDNLIDLFDVFSKVWKVIRRMWVLLLLVLCIGMVGGAVREKMTYHKKYEASASFIVTAGGNNGTASYYNQVTMEQLNTTFPYIITSGILNRIVANDLGLPAVPGMISASVLEETNLFQIKVVSDDALQAYYTLQSVIKNYPSVAKYVLGDTTLKLIDETGIPTAPMTAPNYVGAAVKGGLLGCILDFVIIVLTILLRNTVKSEKDINKFLNIKYLAGIPQERVKRRSKKEDEGVLLDRTEVTYFFKEAINMLQIRLNREMKRKHINTLLVTSTLAGEGKTTVICNLASMMASKGYKVLLIDADFRNPSVASLMQLEQKEKGIEDVLLGNAHLDEAMHKMEDKSLWVLPGVKPQERVSRLYRNGRLQSIVERYQEKMDIVLIDTPPCGMMNDAALAAEYAQGVLLVIRQDFARRVQILEGVELFAGGHTPILGCVINGEETGIGSYGYGKYGYGKYGYGKYGYGKYGYGKYGYGGEENRSENEETENDGSKQE